MLERGWSLIQHVYSIDQSWSDFKNAIVEAPKELHVPDKEEMDSVAERVCKVSRMKQEAWLK